MTEFRVGDRVKTRREDGSWSFREASILRLDEEFKM